MNNTTEQILKLELIKTIKLGLRHKLYDRSVEIAEWNRMIATGEGQGEYIHNYKERETEQQKKNREAITKTLTRYAFTQVLKVFKRLRRVDNINYEVSYGEDVEKLSKLRAKLNNWKGEQKGIKDYWFDKLEYYAMIDPNAWGHIDRTGFKDANGLYTDVEPNALIFDSCNVINYKKVNGRTEWIIVCLEHTEEYIEDPTTTGNKLIGEATETIDLGIQKKKENIVKHYYLYTKGYCVKLEQYDKITPEGDFETVEVGGVDGEGKYKYSLIDMGSKEVPFFQLGAYLDYETKGELFVSVLEDAREVFEDLINLKSQFDLTKYLHAFPQKLAFSDNCQYEDSEGNICDCGELVRPGYSPKGKYSKEYTACPSCGGSGKDVHISAQDVILINLPADKTEYIPLKDMVAYVQLPDWLPKWQWEMLNDLLTMVSTAIFQQDVFKKPEFEETATASKIELDKIYDTLTPYATLYSRVIEKSIRLTGQYLGMDTDKLKVSHNFPKDFKMETLSELIQIYEAAQKAGVSYEILWSIHCRILTKLFANDKDYVEKVKAEQCFKPFADKNAQETTFVLSGRAKDDFDRILWENFDRIFKEIHEADPLFHKLTYDLQKNLVIAKVDEIKKSIKYLGNTEPVRPFVEEEENIEEDEQ